MDFMAAQDSGAPAGREARNEPRRATRFLPFSTLDIFWVLR
jgi:hypothetical protein